MKQPKADQPDPLTQPDGEDSWNVREVHGTIMRELPDPIELYRRVPWWLRHTYVAMAIGLLFYLIVLAGDYDWDAFQQPLQRLGLFQDSGAEEP